MAFSSLSGERHSVRIALKASAATMLLGLGAMGNVQAAQLTCGTPLRIHTAKATWSSDAQYVAGGAAAIVDDYKWRGWFDKTTAVHTSGAGNLAGAKLQGDWLSFGDAEYPANAGGNTGTGPYPAVSARGDVANGAWVQDRVTFYYNEPITVGSNVNLSTIKVTGSGGVDDNADFVVRPASPPSGATNWLQKQSLGMSYGTPGTIALDGRTQGLGFYYGDNTIGFVVYNTGATTASAGNPMGVIADFEITADCQDEPPPQPTAPLVCPAGSAKGDIVEIGPFTTNARDWKWSWRTKADGSAIENVEQPLFDSYRYRSYFNPNQLPAGSETSARWISPGTVNPAASDIPGVPYPVAVGQAKSGFYGDVFTMNQPVTIGNNVDLASIKLTGRFGFDDTGDSVFVQPAGQSTYAPFVLNALPDGYGGFTSYTTPAITGFQSGKNTVGLVLNGGQVTNDCVDGVCALAAIAEFKITAACTGVDPEPLEQTITFPAQSSPRKLTDGAFGISPAATASSTLPVAYTSLTPGVCTVSGSTVTPLAYGTCTIAADQGGGIVGSKAYNPAAQVTQSVVIGTSNLASATPVPALGVWALGLLAGLLGVLGLRRRNAH